jgi:D-alanyl-D-alanine-carboxypeptidase/D-alanyl-D-alanine-endopeptidase
VLLRSRRPGSDARRRGAPLDVRRLLTLLRAHAHPDDTPLAEALRLAQRPRARANRWLQVALAWHLVEVRGTSRTALWHNGGPGGFCSVVAVVPDADAGWSC